jgi:SAM-dependent methyltransferase
MKKFLIGLIFVSFIIFPSKTFSQERELDVPYVPTPYPVVAEMLKMAEVGKDDLLYDLGCGDGRIVIMAAQQFGTHGVGVDLNPERIKESKENAATAGVENLVQFLEQDLFQADIHNATVVTLYLLSSVNLRLRPRLLRELRPGTRIVSHDFAMAEWQPDKSLQLTANNNNHSIYFWVIPANVTGTWEWTLPAGKKEAHYRLQIDQKFQMVDGTITVDGSKIAIKDAKLNGDKFQFVIEQKVNKEQETLLFEGRVSGNYIDGTVQSQVQPKSTKETWKAKRDPLTIKALDITNKKEESPFHYIQN